MYMCMCVSTYVFTYLYMYTCLCTHKLFIATTLDYSLPRILPTFKAFYSYV